MVELIREVMVPQGVSLAIETDRPELLKLAARPMDKQEVSMLLDCMGVMMDTMRKINAEKEQVQEELDSILTTVEKNRQAIDKAMVAIKKEVYLLTNKVKKGEKYAKLQIR